jgi:alpha-L-arabinofuranosidase
MLIHFCRNALSVLLLFAWCNVISAQPIIHVDVTRPLSDVSANPVGMNTCWLTDSDVLHPDAARNFTETVSYLGMGSLRFPYGALADDYLWTTPPYADAMHGLTPRIAVMPADARHEQWPEYVNADGSFNNDMDFDDFIKVCQRTGAEPVIMVNILSYLHKGGPTLEQLKDTAVEWVRYANVVRDYNVKFWEIGNEVEGKYSNNMDDYIDIYLELYDRMKAVDPTIKLGYGAHAREHWFNEIIKRYPDKVDFLIPHPYVNTLKNYEEYLAHDGSTLLIERVDRAVHAIRKWAPPEHKKRIKALVTECSSFSWRGNWNNHDNNMLKAMVYFEMLGNMLNQPEVEYVHFWGAHSPWRDKNVNADDRALDWNNRVLPMGYASKVMADFLRDQMVYADRVTGHIRTWASYAPDTKSLTVYLLNKNSREERAVLQLQHYDGTVNPERWTFSGINGTPEDTDYTWTAGRWEQRIELVAGKGEMALPPCSITVLTFSTEY